MPHHGHYQDQYGEVVNVTSGLPSSVTSTQNMFQRATNFNGDISSWDTSNVTAMNGMFGSAIAFNQNIGLWDTSNVFDMWAMFYRCSNFNGNISTWDTSNVVNMGMMFYDTPFNKNIENWDVSSVTNMQAMFGQTNDFNQPIGSWYVSSVTNFCYTFGGATAFNQDISGWNTSGATNMSEMFIDASSFNQPIGSWDVTNINYFSGIPSMDNMFENAHSFNQDLSNWNVEQATGEPVDFDKNAISWTLAKPRWGQPPIIQGEPPNISFGTNGSTTWASTHSTSVNIVSPSGNSIVGRYYRWTVTQTEPSSISSSFTGSTISTPNDSYEGDRYLWVRAVDEFGNESIERSDTFRQDRRGPTVSSSTSSINCRITINDASDDGVGLATNYTRRVLPSSTDWGTDTVLEGQIGSGYLSVEVRDDLGNTTTRSLNCGSGGGGSIEVCDPPCGPYTHCCNGSCIHMTQQCNGGVLQ